MFKKDKCSDLFLHLPAALGYVDQVEVDYASSSQYKLTKQEYLMTWRILELSTKSKMISGIAFIKAALARIELSKKLFKLDIEELESIRIQGDL